MAYGAPICACCGATDNVAARRLYRGAPDDLTVWLCQTCHGRIMQRELTEGEKRRHPRGTAESRSAALSTHRENLAAHARRVGEILEGLGPISANAAAKELTRRGVRAAQGGKWTARSVVNIRQRLKAFREQVR